MKKSFATLICILALAGAAKAPAVVINEFVYNTEGGNCFVELFNRSTGAVDISGWKLQWTPGGGTIHSDTDYTAARTVTIPSGTILQTGEFFLIASQDVFQTVPDIEGADSGAVFALPSPSNQVEGIRLIDATSARMDTVLYAHPSGSTINTNLTDDSTLPITGARAGRYVNTAALGVGGSGSPGRTVDLKAMFGSGARRQPDGPSSVAPGLAGEGYGFDSNNSANDFTGFETGSMSPNSHTSPVTLSRFDLE